MRGEGFIMLGGLPHQGQRPSSQALELRGPALAAMLGYDQLSPEDELCDACRAHGSCQGEADDKAQDDSFAALTAALSDTIEATLGSIKTAQEQHDRREAVKTLTVAFGNISEMGAAVAALVAEVFVSPESAAVG